MSQDWVTCYLIVLLITCVAVGNSQVDGSCSASYPHGSIRLRDGRNKFEGRVEVCHDGVWKTVCNRGWYGKEANVTCRQLGLSGSLHPIEERNSTIFGHGSGEILRVIWRCNGTENHLLECLMIETNWKCEHDRDAGVYCYGRNPSTCFKENSIRLSNGSSDGSRGRVEICRGGLWGTVCDDGWDSNDATVVCRQLGFTNISYGIPTTRAYFGEGRGPIHLSRTQCSRRDTSLSACTNDSTCINRCDHNEDAGVICFGSSSCTNGDVRLIGGRDEREGRVEICYNRVWGTVCAYGWDEIDAHVVCTQLGYGTPAVPVNNSGVGNGPVLFSNISCGHQRPQSRLFECVHLSSLGQSQCHNENNTAGVICPKSMQPPTTESQKTTTVTAYSTDTVSTLSTVYSTDAVSTLSTVYSTDAVSTLSTVYSTDTVSTLSTVYSTDAVSTLSTVYAVSTLSSQSATSSLPVAIIGAVSGVLALGIICVFAIVLFVITMFILRRKTKSNVRNKKESMDNPTYEENIFVGPLATAHGDQQRSDHNSIRTDHYTCLNKDTMMSEAAYDTVEDARSLEATYAVPEDAVGVCDDICYSVLGPADYAILEPHIPVDETQQQHDIVIDGGGDDYSHLQHI